MSVFPSGDSTTIVATAGRYYRNARYLLSAAAIAAGLWFAYDGWVKYPQANRDIQQAEQAVEKARVSGDSTEESRWQAVRKGLGDPHSPTDIRVQKALAVGLPLAGLCLLGWMLYNSRGSVRLEGDVLHVPGHRPIPLSSVRSLDDAAWQRKGVAHVVYDTGSGPARARLDDFVYDRKPIDQIHDAIATRLGMSVSPDA